MIKLTFEFQTVEEAVRFLHRNDATIAAAVAHDTPLPTPKPKAKRTTPPATAPVEDAAPIKVVEKIPNGPIYADPAPVPVKAAPKVPNAPVQAVAEVNEVAVRAALREVVNTKSMKVAADILKGFGATSISQIKPEQYADFIKECGK